MWNLAIHRLGASQLKPQSLNELTFPIPNSGEEEKNQINLPKKRNQR